MDYSTTAVVTSSTTCALISLHPRWSLTPRLLVSANRVSILLRDCGFSGSWRNFLKWQYSQSVATALLIFIKLYKTASQEICVPAMWWPSNLMRMTFNSCGCFYTQDLAVTYVLISMKLLFHCLQCHIGEVWYFFCTEISSDILKIFFRHFCKKKS